MHQATTAKRRTRVLLSSGSSDSLAHPGDNNSHLSTVHAQAQGSGFFISPDGFVVTNNHVVANAVQLQIVMDDGKIPDAKVVGTDPKTDLALLKVEDTRSRTSRLPMSFPRPASGSLRWATHSASAEP